MGAKIIIIDARGITKLYSTVFLLIFIILEVIVVEAPAKRPIALATVKSRPKKLKIGIIATPAPAPPIENKIERSSVIKLKKKVSYIINYLKEHS